MKKCFLFLLAMTFLFSSMAFAVPSLPEGPLFVQLTGKEQIKDGGGITTPEGNSESSWGIFRVSNLATGDTSADPQFFAQDDIFWTAGDEGGYITGMFYGLEFEDTGPSGELYSTGGQIDFYYQEPASAPSVAGANPSDRSSDGKDDTFDNFTTGTHLASVGFLNGAIVSGEPNVSVTGTATPTSGGFTGIADSFGVVLDTDGSGSIDSGDGVWAEYLAQQYFNTELGSNTADLRFRNIYTREGSDSWDDLDNDIFGASLTDPALAYGVPEPGTLLLFGTGLLGLAAFGRRKFMKKS